MSEELKEIGDWLRIALPYIVIVGAALVARLAVHRRRRLETSETNPNAYSNDPVNNTEDSDEYRIQTKTLNQLLHDAIDEDETYRLESKAKYAYQTNDSCVGTLIDNETEMPFVYEHKGYFEDNIATLLLNYSVDNNTLLTLDVEINREENSSRVLMIKELKGTIGAQTYRTSEFDEESIF